MRISTRRTRRVALALLAGAALAFAPISPASAASFNGNCEGGEVCVYNSPGYGGSMADFYDNVSNYNNWHYYNSANWLANSVDSVKNKAYWSCVSLFDGANFSGELMWMPHNSENGNLFGNSNRAESHKFANSFPRQCGSI